MSSSFFDSNRRFFGAALLGVVVVIGAALLGVVAVDLTFALEQLADACCRRDIWVDPTRVHLHPKPSTPHTGT